MISPGILKKLSQKLDIGCLEIPGYSIPTCIRERLETKSNLIHCRIMPCDPSARNLKGDIHQAGFAKRPDPGFGQSSFSSMGYLYYRFADNGHFPVKEMKGQKKMSDFTKSDAFYIAIHYF